MITQGCFVYYVFRLDSTEKLLYVKLNHKTDTKQHYILKKKTLEILSKGMVELGGGVNFVSRESP